MFEDKVQVLNDRITFESALCLINSVSFTKDFRKGRTEKQREENNKERREKRQKLLALYIKRGYAFESPTN